MLEFYEAYQDYTYLMDLTERMLREATLKVLGATKIMYQGQESISRSHSKAHHYPGYPKISSGIYRGATHRSRIIG